MTCNIRDQFRSDLGLADGSSKNLLVEIQKQKQKIEDEENKPLNGSLGSGGTVGDNYIPMSMAAGIITAFLAMITYSNQINNQQNQLSQSWAKAMMGETTDSLGHVTINVDDSIAGLWYNSSVNSGAKQAAGIFDQGIGSLIGGIAGVASLGALAGKSWTQGSEMKGLQSDLESARNCRQLFDNPQESQIVSAPAGGPETPSQPPQGTAEDPTVTRYMNDMKQGLKISVDNDATRAAATKAAAQLKATDPDGFGKAVKAANKRVSEANSAMKSSQSGYQDFSGKVQIASQATQGAGQAFGSMGQATNTNMQAQQKAESDVTQQNLQQMQGSADKATQSAQTNHESANSMATALGQTLQATNR